MLITANVLFFLMWDKNTVFPYLIGRLELATQYQFLPALLLNNMSTFQRASKLQKKL